MILSRRGVTLGYAVGIFLVFSCVPSFRFCFRSSHPSLSFIRLFPLLLVLSPCHARWLVVGDFSVSIPVPALGLLGAYWCSPVHRLLVVSPLSWRANGRLSVLHADIYIYIYIYAHVLRNFPKVAITHYHKIFACSCICCVYEAYFHPYLKGKWLDCRPVLALASMTCPFSSSFDRLMTEWKHADKSSYKF